MGPNLISYTNMQFTQKKSRIKKSHDKKKDDIFSFQKRTLDHHFVTFELQFRRYHSFQFWPFDFPASLKYFVSTCAGNEEKISMNISKG